MASTAGDLGDVVQQVVEERLGALHGLRAKVDELAALQEQEEAEFARAMQGVLLQSTGIAEAHREAEEGHEAVLAQERQERDRAIAMLKAFKRDGTAVMSELKAALKEAQANQAAEADRRTTAEREAARLRQAVHDLETELRAAQSRPPPVAAPQRPAAAADAAVTSAQGEQLAALAGLLEEQEAVIAALRAKVRDTEGRVAAVTQQRDRLLDEEAAQLQGAGAGAEEAAQLTAQFHAAGPEGEGMPAHDLSRLAHLLLRQLRAEQLQRLRVEEQSARMAAAQDTLLRRMERRNRELTDGSPRRGGPKTATPDRPLAIRQRPPAVVPPEQSPPRAAPSRPQPKTRTPGYTTKLSPRSLQGPPPSTASTVRRGAPAVAPAASSAPVAHTVPVRRADSSDPARVPPLALRGVSSGSFDSNSAMAMPRPEETHSSMAAQPRGTGHAPPTAGDPRSTSVVLSDEEFAPDEADPSPPSVGSGAPPLAAGGVTATNAPAAAGAPLSLEEQLEAVTAEFHQSLDSWQAAVHTAESLQGTPRVGGGPGGVGRPSTESGRPSAQSDKEFFAAVAHSSAAPAAQAPTTALHGDDDADFLPESPSVKPSTQYDL